MDICALEYGQSLTMTSESVRSIVPDGVTAFLTLSNKNLLNSVETLETYGEPVFTIPAWRATLALESETGSLTSFQGEIDPFPAPASLLTFGYFLQAGESITNYLIFMNLEHCAKQRYGELHIRDASNPEKHLETLTVKNNHVNILTLSNSYCLPDNLLVLSCKTMAGIPVYFSASKDLEHLSLEHTHPPASSIIIGNRFRAQSIMKRVWFSAMADS